MNDVLSIVNSNDDRRHIKIGPPLYTSVVFVDLGSPNQLNSLNTVARRLCDEGLSGGFYFSKIYSSTLVYRISISHSGYGHFNGHFVANVGRRAESAIKNRQESPAVAGDDAPVKFLLQKLVLTIRTVQRLT